MSAVFADTVFFLALINPDDQWHERALTLAGNPPGSLITTEFVLTEVGDGLSRAADRPHFARLLQSLSSQADVEIVPASHVLFSQACDLHAQRADKDWSLTDCTSFVVMRARNLRESLTADHHFAQAGFVPLMS